MEISVQGVNSLKIRGKQSAFYINPQDKTSAYNAVILIGNPDKSRLKIREDVVIIDGPGEYEAGGIKITGIKANDATVYSITLDGLDLILGECTALEKVHQKIKEHHIALIYASEEQDASFVTSLATHALLFYGANARSLIDQLAKEEKKETSRYQISSEKLPPETETILLV
jgi:hypothetical protein